MAKRLSLDDKLAAVRLLRDRDPSLELTAELKTAIEDKSNLIVAAGAAIAGDHGLVELAPDWHPPSIGSWSIHSRPTSSAGRSWRSSRPLISSSTACRMFF